MIDKSNKKSLITKLFIIFEIFLGAYYCMNLVNEITLSTTLQRIFVFLYFFVILFIGLMFIKNKLLKNKIVPGKNILTVLSIIISLLILCIGRYFIIPDKYDNAFVYITAMNSKNSDSQGYETWISKIKLGDKSVDLSELADNASSWEFRENTLYSNGEYLNNSLPIYVSKGQNIAITFEKHAWSGQVLVELNQAKTEYDLYSKIAFSDEIIILPQKQERVTIDTIILCMGAFAMIFHIVQLGIYKLKHII